MKEFSCSKKYVHQGKKSLSKLLVPANMEIEEIWDKLVVKKVKVKDWKEITQSHEIENYLLRWSVLHHNQSAKSPPLNPTYGLNKDQKIPKEENEYAEWLS